MDMAFIKVLNMSISASWLVLAVLVLRLLLKKSPKWISVALWALVAVRLICPFSPESVMSLVPENATEEMVESISGGYYGDAMIYSQGSAGYEAAMAAGVTPQVGDNGYQYVLTQPNDPTKPVQTVAVLFGQIWVAGMVIMLTWAWISYFRLKKKVNASIDVGNGVFICDYIDTPFILGIVRPRIYLPSIMEPDSASHVLAHERAHIARKDHWWKPFGYLLLTVYWFNPVLWLAYILLCRDIELACDEKVIRDMESHQKKAYSEALLSCSVSRRHVAACPLAFGEVGVKERVKAVLNYKKPAFWIVLVAILALIVTAVCFLTDPVKEEPRTYRVEEVVYRNPVLSYYMTEETAPQFQITGESTLRVREQGQEWKNLGEFSKIRLSDVTFDDFFRKQPMEGSREAWLLYVTPGEESNGIKFYLLWQESGGCYMAEGMSFPSVYPAREAVLDSMHTVNWLYRLSDANTFREFGESPYIWTSTVESQDIYRAWAKPYYGATYTITLEGSRLEELVGLLNAVREDEIIVRKPVGVDDPRWNYDGASVTFFCSDGTPIMIRYADDTVMIDAETGSGIWETDGYWVIENEAFQQWMRSISLGGTEMLSDENRAEIRQLLRMEQVQFFTPQQYDDLLFVGCAWDHGRGLGVAVYEPLADGYRLLKLIRGDEVKTCASGSDLYYCDYLQYRIFLVMNESITGMEWAGAYEATYAIDTHPGLIVEHSPKNMGSMYRFCYSGGATTMYMDWENQTHGQVPDYTKDVFANPNDPHSVFTNLRNEHVDFIWVTEMVDVGNGNDQAHTTDLDADETEQILNLLHNLPEDAFAQAEYPDAEFRYMDINIHNYTGQQYVYPMLRFILYENAIYYQLLPDSLGVGQVWKIDAPELARRIESFFAEDKSQWHKFMPTPKIEGEVSCDFDGMEVYVPKLAAFEYAVTEEGIRFKPEKEEGYILVQYCPKAFDYTHVGYRIFSNIYGETPSVRAFAGAEEIWSFVEVTVSNVVWNVPKPDADNMPSMNIRLINEDKADWVEEYTDRISWILYELSIHVNS